MGRGVEINDKVTPACMPSPNTEYTPGKMCYVSGWGQQERKYKIM